VDLLDRHKVQSHLYADDTQLYASALSSRWRGHSTNTPVTLLNWRSSVVRLSPFSTQRRQDGSYLVRFARDHELSVQIGAEKSIPATAVRDLGVQLDEELSMKAHVAKVSSACYYHLRRLRQIRRRVEAEVTTQLVLALVDQKSASVTHIAVKLVCVTKFTHSWVKWTSPLLTCNLLFKFRFTVVILLLLVFSKQCGLCLCRNFGASLLYFVVRVGCRRKTVHVRYLISWWGSCDDQLIWRNHITIFTINLNSLLLYFMNLDLSLHVGGCRISTMLLFILIYSMVLRYMVIFVSTYIS